MKWIKKGLIYKPNPELWWQKKYCILPTPVYLPELKLIRVFFATTCDSNYGRITFIDLNENNPSEIIYNYNKISLEPGVLGAFDDCGVNPSAIIRMGQEWQLYYAGYQRHFRTPYSIFSGIAHSKNGLDFVRIKQTPFLERTTEELNIRSAPTILFENNIYKMWYVSDSGWENFDTEIFKNKLMPIYSIKYGESPDGKNWIISPESVLTPVADEFGFGRPYIFKSHQIYHLYYSIRKRNTPYRIGYADSKDGIKWERKDNEIGIDVSETGWDSEMICYPAVIKVKDKTYLFYNGNNNGETGFGYAELVQD